MVYAPHMVSIFIITSIHRAEMHTRKKADGKTLSYSTLTTDGEQN
jgi:hypothetical protein